MLLTSMIAKETAFQYGIFLAVSQCPFFISIYKIDLSLLEHIE